MMSIRRTLFLGKSLSKIPLQHNFFCSKSQQSTTTKIEECFVIVLCIGSVGGAIGGGIRCYNNPVVRNYSYRDAVETTTLETFNGFGKGFTTVCLSPIIIPIAMIIAVTRYIEQDISPRIGFADSCN